MIGPDDDIDAANAAGGHPFYFKARNGRMHAVTWCPKPEEGAGEARRFRRCFVVEQVDAAELDSLAARDAAPAGAARPPLDTSGRVLAGVVAHDPPRAVYKPLGVGLSLEREACGHLMERAAMLGRSAAQGGGPFTFTFWGVEYDVSWRDISGAYVVTRGDFTVHGSITQGDKLGTYEVSGVNTHLEFHVIRLLQKRQREAMRAASAMNRQHKRKKAKAR